MGLEIERKYTVNNLIFERLKKLATGVDIRQGYLNTAPERTVRVRTKGEKGYLTIKGKTVGIERAEFEYEIPHSDALALLELCEPYLIEKTRYTLSENNMIWELDVFEGIHKGLIIAELELEDKDKIFNLPDWIDKEVSENPIYYNSALSKNPWIEQQ